MTVPTTHRASRLTWLGRRSRGRPTSVLDDRDGGRRLVVRFAGTGLATFLVVAIVTAVASHNIGIREAVADAVRVTALMADIVVKPVLTDAVLTREPAAIAELDEVIRAQLGHMSLVRVKIWDRSGTVVYSDEPRLVGQQFELGADELEAFRTGKPTAAPTDLSERENQFEAPTAELLEVYLPMRTPSGAEILFEAYYSSESVAASGSRMWLRFVPFSLGALALLELLQVPIALALARRLRRTQAQREEMFRRALEATDAERLRIASDLHDGVVQDLAGVAFSLGAVAMRAGGTSGDRADIREAAEQVRRSVRDLRSLLVEIYPPELYREGLAAVLSHMLSRVESLGLRTSLQIDAPLASLGMDRTELIYRVAREGLRNVVLHADASSVEIRISPVDDVAVLSVVDDGRGFDPARTEDRQGHLGLRVIAGLAAALGAVLDVESKPGSGTTLRLAVPSR